MRTRVVRWSVVTMLLVLGGVAAARGLDAWHEVSEAASQQRALNARVDEVMSAIADIGHLQAEYVAGRDPSDALERFPQRLREISAESARLSTNLRSEAATEALQSFVDSTSAVAQSDARARDHLLLGDAGTAAHILLGESHVALAAMNNAMRSFRDAETAALERERDAVMSRAWALAGGTAIVWFMGLVGLAFLNSPPPATSAQAPPDVARAIEPAALAELCTALARVHTAPALNELLDRASSLLDAAGVVIWLRAGEELVPVTARGYELRAAPQHPLRLDADASVPAAWRTGTIQTAFDSDGRGAIAAPLFGPDACTGVFMADIDGARTTADDSLRPAVAMIAAQLSAVVSGSSAPAATRDTGT